MIEGFVTAYRTSDAVHLYFFPGIGDDGKPMYRNIDFSSIKVEYTYSKKSDGAVDFIFAPSVTSISCSLIDIASGTHKKVFLNRF